MKLIYTHDGLIGMTYIGKTQPVWADSIEHAVTAALCHYNYVLKAEAPTREELDKDIRYAIDHMAKTGDTIAEFGVFGSFMYTTREPECEF